MFLASCYDRFSWTKARMMFSLSSSPISELILSARREKQPMMTRNATMMHTDANDIRLCVKMLIIPSLI